MDRLRALSSRKLARAFWIRLVAYEDAVRRAIQAHNEYVDLRHPSGG